jgi:hypothetical protein
MEAIASVPDLAIRAHTKTKEFRTVRATKCIKQRCVKKNFEERLMILLTMDKQTLICLNEMLQIILTAQLCRKYKASTIWINYDGLWKDYRRSTRNSWRLIWRSRTSQIKKYCRRNLKRTRDAEIQLHKPYGTNWKQWYDLLILTLQMLGIKRSNHKRWRNNLWSHNRCRWYST